MSETVPNVEEQEQAMEQDILNAVANFGVPAVIAALVKACEVAYEVESEQEPTNWTRLETYKHYAKQFEEMAR